MATVTEKLHNGNTNAATTYTFPFQYIKLTDVKVEVLEGSPLAWVSKTKDTDYEFPTATTVKFLTNKTPPAGTNNVRIYRETDSSKLIGNFYPNAAIRSQDLNENFNQNLFLAQETENDSTTALNNTRELNTTTGVWKTAIGEAVAAVNTANAADAVADAADAIADAAKLATDRLVGTTANNGSTWTVTGNNTNASTDPKGLGYAITTADNASATAAAAFQRDGSATMTGNIVFEGATDNAYETTVTVVDPTADRTITLPNETGTVITSASTNAIDSDHYVDGSIDLAHMSPNSVDSDQYVDGSIDRVHLEADIIDGTKLADNAVDSEHITSGSIDRTHLAADVIDGTKIDDDAITSEHIAAGAVNAWNMIGNNVIIGQHIADDAIGLTHIAADNIDSQHYAASSIDTEHIADLNITTGLIANLNVTEGKIADNAVTFAKLGCEETSLTANSDTTIPTSKAVSDYVVNLLNDAGGFRPIQDHEKFPTSNPDPDDGEGTIVSIADAGGLKVADGSGSGDYAGTAGHSIGAKTTGNVTVTITGIDSTLHGTTIAAGKGMLVQTTANTTVYTYHRLVLDEAGVAAADTLITDFNQRYRVHEGEPSTHLTDGDLVFDTSANKMKVYDETNTTWKEITAGSGDYKILTILDTDGSAFDGANQSFNLKDGDSAANVTKAQQLLISVNGVIQKPNSGTSAPAEGFALVDSDTIIFSNAPGAGASVFVTQIGVETTLNTPADNSVTTAKIASAAVTTAKIADDAVDGSKLANNIDIAGTLDVTSAATFDSTGTFAGNVQSGGNPSSGTAAGVVTSYHGYVHACRSTATDTVWAGYTQGTADLTSQIKANGAATFTSATINGDEFGGAENVIKCVRSGHNQMLLGSTGSGNVCIYLDADNGDFSSGQYTKLIAYNSGDLALENWMTGGDLLFKTENSTRLTIANDGAATFASNVIAQSSTNEFVKLEPAGVVKVSSDNAGMSASDAFRVTYNGTDVSKIGYNGAATFAGNVQAGAAVNHGGSDTGVTIKSSGLINATRATGSNIFAGFKTGDNTQTSQITSDGDATFAGSVKIGGTAAANEIDDYEEGSWTPVLTRTGTWTIGDYCGQDGKYTKVGNMVTVWCYVCNSNISGTPSTKWTLTGLPFTNGRAFTIPGSMGRNYMSGDTNDRDVRLVSSAATADLYTTSADTQYTGNATYAIWEFVLTYMVA